MKKFTLTLCTLVIFSLPPLMAQDWSAPKALEHEFLTYLEGEWVGATESPMGKSNDQLIYKLGLDGQFLMQEATVEMTEVTYKGSGFLTLTPEGKVTGNWIDNFRGIFQGSGTIEGNVMTVIWESARGKSTRITEKTDDDHMIVIGREETPQGTQESKGTYTRKSALSESE